MSVTVFTAGVALDIAKDAAARFEKKTGISVEIVPGGSVELVKKIRRGDKCDAFISADDTIMTPMLMPDYIDGYVVFAANRMVVAANHGTITSADWKEKLLAPDATFGHMDPQNDPSGYRSVMAMILADNVEAGLSEKLLHHKGHVTSGATYGLNNLSACDYVFTYGSLAVKQGLPFAILPPQMDLSDDTYADLYKTAVFHFDAGGSVSGSAINHAAAVLKTSENAEDAAEFMKEFLETDFAAFGFAPKQQVFGTLPF